MPVVSATYLDPGTYIGERVTPGATALATQPLVLGIVAHGSRLKQVNNEALLRGAVEGETLTFVAPSGTGGAISAPSAGNQTFTPTVSPSFDVRAVDGQVVIRGATNPLNNGTFPIVNVPGATNIVYYNPTGVVEAGFTGTYAVVPYAVLGGSGSPARTTRSLDDTQIYRNAKALSDSRVSFRPAYIESAASFPAALVATSNDAVGIQLDGNVPLTLIFTAGAGATTVIGTQVTVGASTIASLATVSAAEFVAAINEGLNPTDSTANAALTALGYGAAYANAARLVASTFRVVSPLTTPAADVEILSPISGTAVDDTFGVAGLYNRTTPTIVEIDRTVYSSTNTYQADYVDLDDQSDALDSVDVQEIIRVGNVQNVQSYDENTDYVIGTDAIDWSPGTSAQFTSSVADTYNLTTNDTFAAGFAGRTPINFDLNALASPPRGYANPAVPAAATAAEVAANINAILAASPTYGLEWRAAASVLTVSGSDYLVVTDPTTGESSSITFVAPSTAPTNDATSILFGLQTTQLPYSVVGTGAEPAFGSTYFVSYTIDRPSTDYNVMRRFTSRSVALDDLGAVSSENPLSTGVDIAFNQGVAQVVVVQVDDSSVPGSPNRVEFRAGLNATKRTDLVTELVPLSTELGVQLDAKANVGEESTQTRGHYRRAWFGLARNTDPGDRDTPGTYVYTARQTFGVQAESPARGRLILVAPPQRSGITYDVVSSDNVLERLELDSTFLAVGYAAVRVALGNPAATLAFQTVNGFNVDDISEGTAWDDTERAIMASQGTFVVSYIGGNLQVLDPVTTEGGGASDVRYLYPSGACQRDNINRKLRQTITSQLAGIVPVDPVDFLTDVRLLIAAVIEGEVNAQDPTLGKYLTPQGTVRPLNPATDIDVKYAPNDPTKVLFDYRANQRYPVLRFSGTLAVNNPFVGATSGT